MIDPVYPALSRAIAGSLLWRSGVAARDIAAVAWRSSFAARAVTAVLARCNRAAAVAMAAAGGAMCLLLQPAIPDYVRPGLPWMGPLAAMGLVAAMAINGRALEEAWPHSTLARLLARRRPRR